MYRFRSITLQFEEIGVYTAELRTARGVEVV